MEEQSGLCFWNRGKKRNQNIGANIHKHRQPNTTKDMGRHISTNKIIPSLLQTTIFGMAYIVSKTILSRLIYPCTILKIPDTFLKEINKEITNFIFQGTFRNIKKTTLAQTKKGGIGLQQQCCPSCL